MPTKNINLTDELNEYVDNQVGTGRYGNASEVVRAGLRALQQDEKEDQAKLQALREALIHGEQSGIARDGVFERFLAKIEEYERVKVPSGT